jgi:hypothetical protein
MTIESHVDQFAGKPVRDYDPGKGIQHAARIIYRLRISYDDEQSILELLAAFVDDPAAAEAPGIVIGMWSPDAGDADSGPIVASLAAARDKLPNLTAIFLGDIVREENEISWIQQCDVSPLLEAYPRLEHFRVRGGNGLRLGRLRHDALRSLVIESGGLSSATVRDVAAARLPALEHLELWLGEENYGGDATVQDLRPILSGKEFPRLRYLGLRDSAIADEVAGEVANAPVLPQVRVLDLSLGNLSDKGAAALLNSPRVALLEKLDIHHHYVSEDMVKQLKALGITVEARDPKEADEYDGEMYRYIAVAE